MKKIEKYAAIIATMAALVSAFLAYMSWDYNKFLTKATVSLEDITVILKKESSTSANLKFLYLLQNIGQEPIRINKIDCGYYNFKADTFVEIYSDHRILNTIYPGAKFNQPVSFDITGINPLLSNSEIENFVPEWVGKIALIMIIEFKGDRSKKQLIKFYSGYEGLSKTYQLSVKEYEKIKERLPALYKTRL